MSESYKRLRRFVEIRTANYRSRPGVIETVHEWSGPDAVPHDLIEHDLEQLVAEHGAALDELERLRAERAAADDPAPYRRWLTRNLGAAHAAGWDAHADLVSGTLATLGSSKREQCGRAWVVERLADLNGGEEPADQKPEPEPCDGDCDCDCQPGQPCLCPERDCYCGPCRVCDRDEAEQQPEPAPELPDRQAKLYAAIQREGGDWSPLRAREEMVRCGYAVTSERAHQIMKQLAERGYLEQVRPRAYTYRLTTEAPQQPEHGGEAG